VGRGDARRPPELTWTPKTDLSKDLTLSIRCSGFGCPVKAYGAQGTSPLQIIANDMGYPAGSDLYVSVYETDRTGTNILGANFVGGSTRQDFRIEGTVTLINPPPDMQG
jgi:hypothetical protein